MRMTDTVNIVLIGFKNDSVGGHSDLLDQAGERFLKILDSITDEKLNEIKKEYSK